MSRHVVHLTALALAAALAGCAQNPAHQHGASGPGAGPGRGMDSHMSAMNEWHERMARAQTAEERQALMAEHRKLMHEQMAARGSGRGMGMGGGMGMDDCMAPRKP